MTRISEQTISKVLIKALKSNQFGKEDNTIIFQDLTFLENKILELKQLFPPSTLHAIAAKANPLPEVLKFIKKFDVGLEAASIGEIYLGIKSGYKASQIVFDSPLKLLMN